MKKYIVIKKVKEIVKYQLNIPVNLTNEEGFNLLEVLTKWICKLDINAAIVIRDNMFVLLHNELRIAVIQRTGRLECNIVKDVISYDVNEDKATIEPLD